MEFAALTELGGLGLNTAAVVLLYRLHRDIREVAATQARDVADLKKQLGHQWGWINKFRRHLWPQVFEGRQACD